MKFSMHCIWLGLAASLIPAALVNAQVLQQQQQVPQQQGQSQSPQGQALQAERNAEERPDVIAKVNGDPITETELNLTLQAQLEGMKAQLQGQQIDAETMEKLRQETFNKLVESRLVEQHLIEEGPDVEEQEVEKVIEGAQEQVRSQGMTFDEFLASRGHTPESFEKRIEGALAWEKYQQQEITEEKLRQHFEENKEKFPVQQFEQAQPWIVQSYASELWASIVRDSIEDAEIEMKQQEQQSSQRPEERSAEAVGPVLTE